MIDYDTPISNRIVDDLMKGAPRAWAEMAFGSTMKHIRKNYEKPLRLEWTENDYEGLDFDEFLCDTTYYVLSTIRGNHLRDLSNTVELQHSRIISPDENPYFYEILSIAMKANTEIKRAYKKAMDLYYATQPKEKVQ